MQNNVHKPAMPDRPEQIARLLERTTRLLEDVTAAREDTPDERTARRTHQLREHAAALLILCEGLARETGNDPMVTLEARPDGTGRACYAVELENTGALSAN